jgi:hypothetical protein
LFDFQSVSGEAGFTDQLGLAILDLCRAHPGLLRELFGVQADHRAGVGWLGHLLTEPTIRPIRPDDPEIRRDPAARGGGPPAGCAPASAAGTLARIEAFGRAGEVSPDLEDRLAAAFDHITSLQLR